MIHRTCSGVSPTISFEGWSALFLANVIVARIITTAAAPEAPFSFPSQHSRVLAARLPGRGWEWLPTTLLGKHPLREVQALLGLTKLIAHCAELRTQLLILGCEIRQGDIASSGPDPGNHDGSYGDW